MRFPLVAAALVASANPADVRIGPGGVEVPVMTQYYQDQHHRMHAFEVPADWRDYHHPLAWYRTHPQWWSTRDWYRRADGGIDGTDTAADTRASRS